MRRDYDDDDDGEGIGMLPTLVILTALVGGGWLLAKKLTAGQAAAPAGFTTVPSGIINDVEGGAQQLATAFTSAVSGGPVGIRNNNPTNIMWSAANNFLGQGPPDANGYCTFTTPAYGIRAAFLTLQTMDANMGTVAVFDIISLSQLWTKTDVAGWAASVSEYSGIAQTTVLDSTNPAQMFPLVTGMIVAENGAAYANYYSSDVISQAWSLI